MANSSIHIRTATPADAEQIAFVHIESWRTAYRNILSDEFLDKLDVQSRANHWSEVLTEKSDDVFVADCDGEIVGFSTGGEKRDKNDFDSELYAIYVLQQHHHKNIGTLLLTSTAEYLKTCGHSSIYVWVLADNKSKTFYEHLGGEAFDRKEIEIGSQKLAEIAYGWRDINKFIATTHEQVKKRPGH